MSILAENHGKITINLADSLDRQLGLFKHSGIWKNNSGTSRTQNFCSDTGGVRTKHIFFSNLRKLGSVLFHFLFSIYAKFHSFYCENDFFRPSTENKMCLETLSLTLKWKNHSIYKPNKKTTEYFSLQILKNKDVMKKRVKKGSNPNFPLS